MYDAIVIGARCAGSPTAMLLARRGYRVLLVDRSTFPSDTVSTHYIHNSGIACLKRWGLLERLAASNCPPITRMTYDIGDCVVTGTPPATHGVSEAYAPRRRVLDHILVEAAASEGVEIRTGFAVKEILSDGTRVVGMRGRSSGGGSVIEKARLVIGADGLRSHVAKAVSAGEYISRPALAGYLYTYWSGVPMKGAELYLRDGRGILAMPTNDGMTCIAVGWRREDFPRNREDLAGNYMQALQLAPELAERVRSGRREARFVGTPALPNFFRKPFGAGWALVGDAGCHKDSVSSWGITDAFHDAELLADAIDQGFSGRQSLCRALAKYERQRNKRCMPLFEYTCRLASFEPYSPQMLRFFHAIRNSAEDTRQLLGTFNGTVSAMQFFSRENMERILAEPNKAAAMSQR